MAGQYILYTQLLDAVVIPLLILRRHDFREMIQGLKYMIILIHLNSSINSLKSDIYCNIGKKNV